MTRDPKSDAGKLLARLGDLALNDSTIPTAIIRGVRELIRAIMDAIDRGESVDELIAKIRTPRPLDLGFRAEIDDAIARKPEKT